MADQQPDDTRWCDDIDKDLNRQFPEHELFARDGPFGLLGCVRGRAHVCVCRQSELRRVLKAYALTHPAEGYCQAQAPVAATLLMHMPRANAFHCLTQICRYYVPGYYSPGLVCAVPLHVYMLAESGTIGRSHSERVTQGTSATHISIVCELYSRPANALTRCA
jgi:hypothetical protein